MHTRQVTRSKQGFTLIELVVVITLIMIIAPVVGVFIGNYLRGYTNIVIRTTLVDTAELAIRRIERDIHQSLPNSIRIKTSGSVVALEMVNVVEGLRYRSQPPGGDDAILVTDTSDTQFNTLTTFTNAKLGENNYRIVVYNTGASGETTDQPIAGANVYALSTSAGNNPPVGTHVITSSDIKVTLSNNAGEGHILLSKPFQFAFNSPNHRAYVVDTPISYICDTTKGNITQYKNYNLWDVQALSESSFPLSAASSALLAQDIKGCVFNYQPGTAQHNGIVTIQLTVGRGTENITLLHQVGVSNAP